MQNFNWSNPEDLGIALAAVASIIAAVIKAFMTPARYAALAPRVAAVFKLIVAVLPDLIKAAKAVRQLHSGESDVEHRAPKPDPESGPQLSLVRAPENDPEDGQ